MLNKLQLKKVRASLPPNGYQLIADQIGNTTATAVRFALQTPERFKNRKDVADAIVVVMSNYRAKQKENAEKVMEAIK